MKGNTVVPFSELFADTYRTHGHVWTMCYYTFRGMPEWEFNFWVKATIK